MAMMRIPKIAEALEPDWAVMCDESPAYTIVHGPVYAIDLLGNSIWQAIFMGFIQAMPGCMSRIMTTQTVHR